MPGILRLVLLRGVVRGRKSLDAATALDIGIVQDAALDDPGHTRSRLQGGNDAAADQASHGHSAQAQPRGRFCKRELLSAGFRVVSGSWW